MATPSELTSPMLAKLTSGQSPLLLEPHSEELFVQSVLGMEADPRFHDAMAVHDTKALTDDFWDDDDDFISWLRPYNVEDGTLIIPVQGVLMNKLSFKFGSYATGYQYIRRAYERGMSDPEVRAIAFDIDSPGGEVAGNFELVEQIAAGRGQKPMRAVAHDHAYSAAYSIATASDSITVARSGGVGSVGVVTAHIDVSKRMEAMGVKITFIYAGKHKVDGNPYEELPEDVKARIQERIDRVYGEFVALVATNRDMEEQAVQNTEALTYDAEKAIQIGFADRIGSLQSEMADLAAIEGTQMATTPKAPAAEDNGGQITQAQLDSAVADAKTEGHAEGVTAERARITGILNSDEAKTRPAAARMAVNAGMSVEDAKTSLADMPEEATAPKAEEQPKADAPAPTPFAQQMSGPGIGAELEDGKEEQKATSVDDILGAYSQASGTPIKKAS